MCIIGKEEEKNRKQTLSTATPLTLGEKVDELWSTNKNGHSY